MSSKQNHTLQAEDEAAMQQHSAAGFEAEWSLLLAACSALPVSEKIVHVSALASSPIRWNILFQLAEQHGVVCLLYRVLSGVSEVIPPAELRSLRQRYEANLHKALLTASELIRILDGLDSLSIEVMPYKGLALAETLYGDVAARQSGDIDLFIHTRDLARIKAAVRDLGYTTHLTLSEREERAYLVSGYEYSFDSTAGKNLLEVQWALQPRFYAVDFDMEGMLQRAVSVTVAGREMKTPSPEDLVLVLSVHAAKHMWARLIWLCDMAQLMQMPGINWDQVKSQARALGIIRILHVTLLLSQDLLDATLPPACAKDAAADSEAQAWARSIRDQIAREQSCDTESWRYFREAMRLRERRRDRIRFLWRLAVTPGPGEWRFVHLPPPLFPLYRLVRIYRLASRLLQR
jgi:Uncharacterised nucleotidyltransferase